MAMLILHGCEFHYKPPWLTEPEALCGYCRGCVYDERTDDKAADICAECSACPYNFMCIHDGRECDKTPTLKKPRA